MVEGADPERKADVCSDCRFGDRDSYALAIRAGGSGGRFPAYLYPVEPTNQTQTCDRDAGLDGKFFVLRSGMDNVNNWRFISEINFSGSECRLPKGRCSARRSLFCLQYRSGEPRFPRLGAEVSAQGRDGRPILISTRGKLEKSIADAANLGMDMFLLDDGWLGIMCVAGSLLPEQNEYRALGMGIR